MAPLTHGDADGDTLPVGTGVHLERLLEHEVDGEGKLQVGEEEEGACGTGEVRRDDGETSGLSQRTLPTASVAFPLELLTRPNTMTWWRTMSVMEMSRATEAGM